MSHLISPAARSRFRRSMTAIVIVFASSAAVASADDLATNAADPDEQVAPGEKETLYSVLSKAMLVGTIGSGAFYVGVWLGFISRGSRQQILNYLHRPNPPRAATEDDPALWPRVGVFCIFGGLVAAVFQWAQPDNFIPIQAFVLGATWPSVVTRVMAGSENPGGGDGGPGLFAKLYPRTNPPDAPPNPASAGKDPNQPPTRGVIEIGLGSKDDSSAQPAPQSPPHSTSTTIPRGH